MILALDYGDRYIGLASTDQDELIALRHSTIDQNKAHSLRTIADIVMKAGINTVMVGLPLGLSGKHTDQSRKTREFFKALRHTLPATVVMTMVDERLTSKEAERRIKAEGSQLNEAHAEAARILLQDHIQKSQR